LEEDGLEEVGTRTPKEKSIGREMSGRSAFSRAVRE
jgi:hypothetical protein